MVRIRGTPRQSTAVLAACRACPGVHQAPPTQSENLLRRRRSEYPILTDTVDLGYDSFDSPARRFSTRVGSHADSGFLHLQRWRYQLEVGLALTEGLPRGALATAIGAHSPSAKLTAQLPPQRRYWRRIGQGDATTAPRALPPAPTARHNAVSLAAGDLAPECTVQAQIDRRRCGSLRIGYRPRGRR